MDIRAKFFVSSTTKYAGFDGAKVELSPISDSSTPENQQFWKATPNGKIELSITNPKVADSFEPGQNYYVDFSPA